VVREKFFAGKRFFADWTISCDDVPMKIRPDFTTVGTLFFTFVHKIDVNPQKQPAAKHFQTVRTLLVIWQVVVLKVVRQIISSGGAVVAKSAVEFCNVFLLVVFLPITFALEKGETMVVFAPEGFFKMVPFYVYNVAGFVPDFFLAEETNDGFFVFLHFLVRFVFVLLQVRNIFYVVLAI